MKSTASARGIDPGAVDGNGAAARRTRGVNTKPQDLLDLLDGGRRRRFVPNPTEFIAAGKVFAGAFAGLEQNAVRRREDLHNRLVRFDLDQPLP